MNKLREILSKHRFVVFLVVYTFIIFFCCFLFLMYLRQLDKEDNAHVFTKEQAEDTNYLGNKLDISKDIANDLQRQITKIQSNQSKPVDRIVIQAPNIPTATKIVQERIIEKDPTLPKSAIERSDKTMITEQSDNKDYQVGVYKINFKKNWYIGTGMGCQNGNVYIPMAIQRNYDNNHAISVQVNIDKSCNINGGQMMWEVGF